MKTQPIFLLLLSSVMLAWSCSSHSHANQRTGSKEGGAKKKYYESRYGIQLNNHSNLKLYAAIDHWIGVPHRMGACEKTGVDCSCLINSLCREAYNCNTPRDTKGLYEHCKKIDKADINEGDIIFFQMKEGKVDHVGLYMNGGKFVHTSVKKGVMVSDLNEPHFAKAFRAAGRLACL